MLYFWISNTRHGKMGFNIWDWSGDNSFSPEDEKVYNDRPVRSPEISGSSLDVLNVDIKSVTTSFTNVSLATKQTKQNEVNTWTDGGLSPSPLAP